MDAGILRDRVLIQAPDGLTDEMGGPLENPGWVDYDEIWAAIKHQSGVEAMRADSPTSIVKASIRIRWRTDINATMRVVHGVVKYSIKAVLPNYATREYVDLVCEVVT